MPKSCTVNVQMLVVFCMASLSAGLSSKPIDRRTTFKGAIAGGSSIYTTLITGMPQPAEAAATPARSSIAERLDASTLSIPPPSRANELNGVDNTYYPAWLAGTWDVTQTLVNAETPLGLKFVGGPAGSEEIAAKSVAEQRRQLGKPVSLKLRWVPTKFGVAEDRLFNARERLNGFAGRSVVASVEYANVGGSNRASVLALGGTEDDPLQTTIVRFKGPAAQKTFLVAHGEDKKQTSAAEQEEAKFSCSELLRGIFALTNQNTAPPVTTDTETIWGFERVDADTVSARLRLASYLNAQSDSLYFEARNRAVSLADYTLTMKRLAE